MQKRAEEMMKNSRAIDVPDVVDPADWNLAKTKVNTIFVAEVFNTRHGLEEMTKEERDKCGIDDDLAGSREERQFRLWVNSLEIPDCMVNNLYEDVRDGQVLLKVIHKIDDKVVEWNRVEKKADNTFKVGINCNVAFDAMKTLKIKAVGIGPKDIQDGNKKLILALIWQLMRVHYMKIIGNKTDKDIIEWGNSIKGNEDKQIKGFKDANLKNGVFLINLCASIDPEIIDWDLVNQDPEASEEDKSLNARYAISIARKLGAIIFMVWEDVNELNSKMLTIFMSTLYELWQEKQ
jgi:plastin-1